MKERLELFKIAAAITFNENKEDIALVGSLVGCGTMLMFPELGPFGSVARGFVYGVASSGLTGAICLRDVYEDLKLASKFSSPRLG